MKTINLFDGEYAFLSNFYECPVEYNGLKFLSSEAAFQAQKTLIETEQIKFTTLNPSQSKRLGRKVTLREDWEDVKVQIMHEICRAKFTQNPELAQKLIATGNKTLVEGNTWNDTFWGVCRGVGENNLGQILMRVREKLIKKENAEIVLKTIPTLKDLKSRKDYEADISVIETALGTQLSEDYKAYILKYGVITAENIEITGACDSPRLNVVDVTLREREFSSGFPENCYVIAMPGPEGLLLIQTSSSDIFEYRNNKIKKVYNNLSEFLLNCQSF